jgi:hypothetical protein
VLLAAYWLFLLIVRISISKFGNFKAIQDYITEKGKCFIFMGEGQHKIKRKAEQIACNEAIKSIDSI